MAVCIAAPSAFRRESVSPRPDWRATAARYGFDFHTLDGAPYWTEDACYAFSLPAIETDLEAATTELAALCQAVVERAAGDAEVLESLAIPEPYWDRVRNSWQSRERELYGRFDLVYDGCGPARLLEYNADTPTALYESAFFQWLWLEEAMALGLIPRGSDQFNSIQEALIDGFASLGPGYGPLAGPFLGGETLYFTAVADHREDQGTLLYLRDCAAQAGLATATLPITAIGLNGDGFLTDGDDRIIRALFKLYPWEFLVREPFGPVLTTPQAPLMVEPAWKMILANKGVLVWLWRLFPGHPNLLPAAFADTREAAAIVGSRFVRKPLLSREGANIHIHDPALPGGALTTPGPYGQEGAVLQGLAPLPVFTGPDGRRHHTVIGSWWVAGRACGIGIREDDGPITRDTSRFVPHRIDP